MIKAMNNPTGKRSPEAKAKPTFRTDFRLGSRFTMLIAVQNRDKIPSGTHTHSHGPTKKISGKYMEPNKEPAPTTE